MNTELAKSIREGMTLCNSLISDTKKDEELFSKAMKGDVLGIYLEKSRGTLESLCELQKMISALMQEEGLL